MCLAGTIGQHVLSARLFAQASATGASGERGIHRSGRISSKKLRSVDEVIQGYIENLSHLDENINIGGAAALFVHTDGTGTDMEFVGKAGLAHSDTSAELCDSTG